MARQQITAEDAHIKQLLDDLDDLNDGTGNLRSVIEIAVANDANVTAQQIREIWAQATEDWAAETAEDF